MGRSAGRLRIIGGDWRSRIVEFDAAVGVRPTPDRVRQTVFDWLSPLIDGSRVLDLFAGSGALGLEALSRGAAHADFVDSGAAQVRAIRGALEKLGAGGRAAIVQRDAAGFLAVPPPAAQPLVRYDIVFLDPPYAAGLLAPALAALPPWLAPVHRVYLEWPKGVPPALPPGATLLKEKSAGQVSYGLLAFAPTGRPE